MCDRWAPISGEKPFTQRAQARAWLRGCPRAPRPACVLRVVCAAALPQFWRQIAPIVSVTYGEHAQHVGGGLSRSPWPRRCPQPQVQSWSRPPPTPTHHHKPPPCRPSPAPTWASPSPYMGCSHPGSHLPTPPLPSHIRSARTRARARSSPRGPLSAASPCCAAPPPPPFILHASPSFLVCPVPFLLPWWGLPWQLQRTCQGRHRRQHARGL
jgi:hypothetical protein